jgi:hypothetical protein
MPAERTPCPITREQFRAQAARVLPLTINGVPFEVPVKEFSTGSLGWYVNGKTAVDVAGVVVGCSVQVQIVLNNSKDLPAAGATAVQPAAPRPVVAAAAASAGPKNVCAQCGAPPRLCCCVTK